MLITGYQLGKLGITLKSPFKTALRTVDKVEDVVIIVETDSGHIGYGSAPATTAITGETLGSITAAIKTILMPAIQGKEISKLNTLLDSIQCSMVGNTSAKAAVEIALYDLFAQSFDAPLYGILGGGEASISTGITISTNSIDKMVTDSVFATKQGYQSLKIKVGKDAKKDVERVSAIYAAVSDETLLCLDANQGWTPKQSVWALHRLESNGIKIDYIEQPVRADDVEGMKYVTDRVEPLVMADESVFSPKQVINLITSRAVDLVNIKLMKTGGISNAIKIADIANAHDMQCMIGCMMETPVSICAAAHLAVAKSNSITRVDLDAPLLCNFNPVSGGAIFKNSKICLPDTPGLGITGIKNMTLLEN